MNRETVKNPKSVSLKNKGLELVQVCGPYIELYFDWEQIPSLDLRESYYIVEFTPHSLILPLEYARPNSEGPLHFCLKTGVEYQLRLLSVPLPAFTIESDLDPMPQLELTPQHENLIKLAWGDVDVNGLNHSSNNNHIEVYQDGCFSQKQPLQPLISCELVGRPAAIEIRHDSGERLLQVTTNLQQMTCVASLTFVLEKQPVELCLSTAIHQDPGWRVRAEFPVSFQMRKVWRESFLNEFNGADSSRIVGCFRFYENGQRVADIRQWGFSTHIQHHLIDQIQLQEWGFKKKKRVYHFKLQLQVTSAHRELYKYVLLEKQLKSDVEAETIGFSEDEIETAEQNLFKAQRHVVWEQAFIELVLWFKVDGHDWQEFQRDVAHSHRWDYVPSETATECFCEWVLFDLTQPQQSMKVLTSGRVKRIQWPNRVYLRPYGVNRLFACWDLEKHSVEKAVLENWGVGLSQVGFYLKVHEEYLGARNRRADLDCHLIDIFSVQQNIYFSVESNKCFSVEIVARFEQQEISLTPVSTAIVTPRKSDQSSVDHPHYSKAESPGYHCTQREVRHLQGADAQNRAKVMLHLHMHSPNLYRVDPFRESFLRDSTWPLLTYEGAEVHNPPGEWVLRNCLDSWLPILRVLRSLAAESVDYQISLDISPPVANMLSSPRFKDYMSRYLLRAKAYVSGQISLMNYRNDSPDLIRAAQRTLLNLNAIESFYVDDLDKNIIGAFRELELQGFLEISTCTATHGMPAELESLPDALDSQITLAAKSHHRIFGDRPQGIWLAENSFFPGIEHFLAKEGLGYFFVEAEAILCASHKLVEEEFSPVILPHRRVVAFGRSRLGRTQVWDADIGYAGHPDFREYHFRHLGLPIKRITSKTSDDKQPYHADQAEKTARMLAQDFHHKLSEKGFELGHRNFQSIPLISCAYDAELFGHHWWEGPIFLEELLREFYRKGDAIGLTTPSHYLAGNPTLPEAVPNPSTWGHEAVHVKWTDPKVAWTFREIERADQVLKTYLTQGRENRLSDFQIRMVEQMQAEFIRAQSSDLTFVIMAGDFEEDMQREILKYLDYFYRLKSLIDNNIEDEPFLLFRQYENNMFPEIAEYYAIRSQPPSST